MGHLLTTIAATDVWVPLATTIGGSAVTLCTLYLKYKSAVTQAKIEAANRAQQEADTRWAVREDEFERQMLKQSNQHEAMMHAQRREFEKQLQALLREKRELQESVTNLRDTVDKKVEHIIELASQNSRRQGLLDGLGHTDNEQS